MHFSESSRVWIYQSADRQLSDTETRYKSSLNNFVTQWTAHNNQLSAAAELVITVS
jgi:hypothetical protein